MCSWLDTPELEVKEILIRDLTAWLKNQDMAVAGEEDMESAKEGIPGKALIGLKA